MHTVVIVIHLMLVLALIGAVLLQKSEGGGLGIGSTGGFMTSRGSANVLTRATAVLAGGFFATSLILSILAGLHRNPGSILGGRDHPLYIGARALRLKRRSPPPMRRAPLLSITMRSMPAATPAPAGSPELSAASRSSSIAGTGSPLMRYVPTGSTLSDAD